MLVDRIYPKYKTISVIGMAKNAGKTFTVNHLIEEAEDQDLTIGITSIGRDGEQIDVLTETTKPTIFLPAGSLIATTSTLLELSEATILIKRVTPYNTPLGEVVLGEVVYHGLVQISGPQTLNQTKNLAEDMLDLGAEFVIIDGALDRKTAAAPEITDATILATGASYNRSMTRVVEETAHIARLFNLPILENYREEVGELFESKRHGIINRDGTVEAIDLMTSLGAGRKLANKLSDDSVYLAIPGALTTRTIKDLLQYYGSLENIRIVVSDPTKIFIDAKNYKRFQKRGLFIEAFHRSDLVAITANPFAPEGYHFDGHEFCKALQEAVGDLAPVIDLMLGGAYVH